MDQSSPASVLTDQPILWNFNFDTEVDRFFPRNGVTLEKDFYRGGNLVGTRSYYTDQTTEWTYVNPTPLISREKVYGHYSDGVGDPLRIDAMHVNLTDGTSREYVYGAKTGNNDFLSVGKVYSGPDQTGTLDYVLINLADGTSREHAYGAKTGGDGVLSTVSAYSGPNETGVLLYKISNFANGTSAEWRRTKDGSASVELEHHSAPGVKGLLHRNQMVLTDGGLRDHVHDIADREIRAVDDDFDGALTNAHPDDRVASQDARDEPGPACSPVNHGAVSSFVQHLATFGVSPSSSGANSLLAPPPAQDHLVAPNAVHRVPSLAWDVQ